MRIFSIYPLLPEKCTNSRRASLLGVFAFGAQSHLSAANLFFHFCTLHWCSTMGLGWWSDVHSEDMEVLLTPALRRQNAREIIAHKFRPLLVVWAWTQNLRWRARAHTSIFHILPHKLCWQRRNIAARTFCIVCTSPARQPLYEATKAWRQYLWPDLLSTRYLAFHIYSSTFRRKFFYIHLFKYVNLIWKDRGRMTNSC